MFYFVIYDTLRYGSQDGKNKGFILLEIKVRQKRQSNMENPEKTGNIGCTRRRKTKQKHNTRCVGHHYIHKQTQIT